tara:strand:- start:1744 stop:2238 length:495 start_codon:yes stop_codon:yes gene_type:complete
MITKNFSKKNFINFLIIFFIFFLDRISKFIVIYLADKGNNSELFLSKFLNIQLIWNDGIAFGLLSLNKDKSYDILTLFIFFIIVIIFFMMTKSEGLKRYSFLMILGGAVGNIFDRIFSKSVPDFIDFHIGNFHWFIFNTADIFISIGVFFVILSELFVNKNDND